MNLTNICVYAQGYYSNATYEENIMIRTETYEKLKNEIDEVTCYVFKLDGKHSEVKAEVEFQHYTEDELLHMTFDCENNGDTYYYNLAEVFKNNNLDLSEEVKLVENYIKGLDNLIEYKCIIKKSQIDKLKKFIENL